MEQTHNKSTDLKSLSHKTDKKNLYLGGFIVFIIAITPFFFYSYRSLPADTKVWETSLFTLTTSYYSINTFGWFLVGKLVPLLLLLIWFFTCKHWWHWIILVPIAMYSFQLWGIFNESNGMDELEIYFIIPLMCIIVPFVYLIRAKLFNKIRGNDLVVFEQELGLKKSFFQQIKELFQ